QVLGHIGFFVEVLDAHHFANQFVDRVALQANARLAKPPALLATFEDELLALRPELLDLDARDVLGLDLLVARLIERRQNEIAFGFLPRFFAEELHEQEQAERAREDTKKNVSGLEVHRHETHPPIKSIPRPQL